MVEGPALWPTVGLAVLAVFLQTMFAQFVNFRGGTPSLVTIAVVLYAAKVGARRGALFGIMAGVLEDSFAGTGGAWTIATTLTALAVGGISRTFFADGVAMLGALVAIAIMFRDAIFWIVRSTEGYPRGYAAAHLHAALWQALITGACAVVYLLLRPRFITDRTTVERNP